MTKTKRRIVALCLGLMGLVGSSLQASELEARKQRTMKMEAEGWTQIASGVFERQLGPNKVEHLGFGREGLVWTVNKLKRQLERMRAEYEKYPSEDLAKIIDELSVTVAKGRRELRNGVAEKQEILTEAVTGPSCSSICYSATADAYAKTNVQGVAAVAEAKFNSTCGYSGDTSAYAYARATQGTTTSTVTQSDPKTGTNVTSSATASADGGSVSGIPCYSEASASAISSALGISYSTSDTNSSCPVISNPLSVTINGSTFEYFTTFGCRNVTWTSTVSNGTSPYSYQWRVVGSSTVLGTGSSYTRSVCASAGSFTLQLTVTDSASNTATDTHYVDVYREVCECGCNGQICP